MFLFGLGGSIMAVLIEIFGEGTVFTLELPQSLAGVSL